MCLNSCFVFSDVSLNSITRAYGVLAISYFLTILPPTRSLLISLITGWKKFLKRRSSVQYRSLSMSSSASVSYRRYPTNFFTWVQFFCSTRQLSFFLYGRDREKSSFSSIHQLYKCQLINSVPLSECTSFHKKG